MFTGLIETVGTVASVRQKGTVWQIDIDAPKIAGELKNGDSVSVSGACQTVVNCNNHSFSVEMMDETYSRTKLGTFKNGTKVNLERPMRADSRFDGHFVSGHIDGLAKVSKIEPHGAAVKYYFEASSDIISGIVPKGSVTIDGVSLTVIDVADDSFSVELIPTTIADTTNAQLKAGDAVNIETDLVGKYVTKYMQTLFPGKKRAGADDGRVTWETIARYGMM